MKTITLVDAEAAHRLEVLKRGDEYQVRLEDGTELSVSAGGGNNWSILNDRSVFEASVYEEDGELTVDVQGERFRFGLSSGTSPASASSGRRQGRSEVKAPMPGKIVKLLVAVGEPVESGQGVLLFEAMKMQNEIRSPQGGVVADVQVKEGQAVEARELLFTIESG